MPVLLAAALAVQCAPLPADAQVPMASTELPSSPWPPAPDQPSGRTATQPATGDGSASASGDLPLRLADFPGTPFDGLIPPNPVIAAGAQHLLTVTNGSVRVLSRDGDLLSETKLGAFFAPVTEPSDFLTDPRALFDSGRFFIAAVSRRQAPFAAFFLLAVSASADATGPWRHYAFDAARDNDIRTTNFTDLPSLGVDDNAVYLTANMFDSNDLSFEGAKIRVIPKGPLLQGAPATFFDFSDLRVDGDRVFHLQAAHSLGSTLAAFVVNTRFPDRCELNVWRVSNPPGRNPFLARVDVQVGGSCATAPNASQPGTSVRIETGGPRIVNAVWRNGFLWAAAAVGHDWGNGSVATARVFRIRTSGFPSIAVVDDFLQGADGVHVYYPVVAVDADDNLLLGFNRSGVSEYVSLHFAGRSSASPEQPPLRSGVLQKGRAPYVLTDSTGRNRWGDYNGASVDPTDNSLWLIGEYAEAPRDRWGTWVGRFAFPGALFTPTRTRTPTVTPTFGGSPRPTRTPTLTRPPASPTPTVPTRTPTGKSTAVATPSPSPSPSPSPTPSPTSTESPLPSPSATVTATPGRQPADVNGDGRVDLDDLEIVLGALFTPNEAYPTDVNGDRRTTVADAVAVLFQYGDGTVNDGLALTATPPGFPPAGQVHP